MAGIIIMKILEKFLKKEKERIILLRKKSFTYTHKNYWALKMDDGSIEFWAYSCKNNERWYLGKLVNGVVIECEGFYAHVLPWDVQKGALRIFEISMEG